MATTSTPIQPQNLAIFVDYWNFQLSCNTHSQKLGNPRFDIDWRALNKWVLDNVAVVLSKPVDQFNHVGTHVYTSYNPLTPTEQKYKSWVNSFLSIQSGFVVTCLERKKKGNPTCSSCKTKIDFCPSCKAQMNNTEEKGVDTRLSVQMLDLAVNNAYDIAVIISHDADMIPAVQFVQSRGKQVVHFGFTPIGFDLRKACTYNFDMAQDVEKLRRI